MGFCVFAYVFIFVRFTLSVIFPPNSVLFLHFSHYDAMLYAFRNRFSCAYASESCVFCVNFVM